MILKIYDFMTVADLQDKFNECFPELKVEFYHTTKDFKNNLPASPDCKVQDLNKKHENGELEIKSWEPTEKVRVELKKRFGLKVKFWHVANGQYVEMNGDAHLVEGSPGPSPAA